MAEKPFDSEDWSPGNPPPDSPGGPEPDPAIPDMPVPGFVAPLLEEPPLAADDTQPRPPVDLRDEPPVDSLVDTAEIPLGGPSSGRFLLMAGVMLGTVCLCLMLVSFAGFAGYRDGLATNDVKITQTLATGIAEQYATGVSDLSQGYAELAAARFEWIVETIQAPTEYALDSAVQLALARTIAAYTPTLPPTMSPTPSPSPTVTQVPTLIATEPPTATLSPLSDPAYLYDQAAVAMRLVRYEEAIEWLDALGALAPDYRAAEVQAMLMEALTQQGRIYLRGQNEDGEDMLARGVLLVYRADEIGEVEPSTLLGEAIFAEMYINARSYVYGQYYDAALPVLEELCAINCEWGYPSYQPVTVRDLLTQAQAGGTQ